MSKCAVHMMKMKMSAMGGIQSHNQREHESRKNKEIDYEKSRNNFDTVLDRNINYQKAVKDRVAELNLKKAVRKDAVVYCSFIVSSDKGFFERLGEREHVRRERQDREGVGIGLEEPVPFEYCSESYREDCIRIASEKFFQNATEFFQNRYGSENVINGTVHMDESTPHMHLGIVPVTKDGRLSAKTLFTPTELKRLQTDFAEIVGAKYGLERGVEGSEVSHLDEMSFKLQKRQEQLEQLGEKVWQLESRESVLSADCKDLEKRAESLSKTVSDLEARKSTLNGEITVLEAKIDELEVSEKGLLAKFLELPSVKEAFAKFCEAVKARVEQRKAVRLKRDEGRMDMSQWKENLDRKISSAGTDRVGKSAEHVNENDNERF